MGDIRVTALAESHINEWRELFSAYADFYQTPLSDATLQTVWRWIRQGQLHGLGAQLNEQLLGIAHWHTNLRPLRGEHSAYLNDLFVHPNARRQGIGKALIETVAAQAQAQNCRLLRWVTAKDNNQAQALYDTSARKTSWVVYDKTLPGDY